MIQIETEDGSVGWGEASSVPDLTGETIASMEAAVKYLTPHLIGRDPSSFIENMKLIDKMLLSDLKLIEIDLSISFNNEILLLITSIIFV